MFKFLLLWSAMADLKESLPGLQRQFWGRPLPTVDLDLTTVRNEPVRETRARMIAEIYAAGRPSVRQRARLAYYVYVDQMPHGPTQEERSFYKESFWHEPDRTWVCKTPGGEWRVWNHERGSFAGPVLDPEVVRQATFLRIPLEEARMGAPHVQERVVTYLMRELKISRERATPVVQALMAPATALQQSSPPDPETVWDQLNTEGGS